MIPTTINTNERIFKIETAKELLNKGEIKNLWHLWNFEFKRFAKIDLKQM
jgi:hypothetical protein